MYETMQQDDTSNTRPRKADLQIPVSPIARGDASPAPLIDIGANLTAKSFPRERIPDILSRAARAGLTHIILTGTSYKASREVLHLCSSFDGLHGVRLRCTVGIHPHDATRTMTGPHSTTFIADLKRLISADSDGFVVAVGECGLDYDRKFSTHEHQKTVFERQLCLAETLSKPVFLHSRDAHADFLTILRPFLQRGLKAVVHCHTDPSIPNLRELLDAGAYIGLTGMICDERPGRFNTDVLAAVPLERLMIETDSPYLFPRNVPRPWGKWQNEPCLLPWVARKLAEVRGDCSEEEVAVKTSKVAMDFFCL